MNNMLLAYIDILIILTPNFESMIIGRKQLQIPYSSFVSPNHSLFGPNSNKLKTGFFFLFEQNSYGSILLLIQVFFPCLRNM